MEGGGHEGHALGARAVSSQLRTGLALIGWVWRAEVGWLKLRKAFLG